MRMLGLGVAKDEADALYDTFDPDGGGSIDYSELNKALKRRAPMHGCKAPDPPRRQKALTRSVAPDPSLQQHGSMGKLDLVGMHKASVAARRAKERSSAPTLTLTLTLALTLTPTLTPTPTPTRP